MSTPTINRTGLIPTNDSGAGTDGTIWNAASRTALCDAIDAMFSFNPKTKSANYTLLNTDDVIFCTGGSFTITLHAANDATRGNRPFTVKNCTAAGIITVSGPQAVDNDATGVAVGPLDAATIMSDGALWWVV